MASSDHADRRADEADQYEPDAGCPECGGAVRTEQRETICVACGLVLDEELIDHGPEWRGFEDEENRERTGAPLTPARHDRGLSTELWGNTDAKGNPIPAGKRRRLGRMKREHSRSRMRSKAERNLAYGLTETRRVAGALDLPESIRDQACTLFRRAATEDLLPGRSIEAIAAGSVYAACRCNGLPRTLQEVGEVSAVGTERVDNGYTVLNRDLGIPAVPPVPGDYVRRIASDLGISNGTCRRAIELAGRAAEAREANGCNPAGLAAGCLYRASRERDESVTQAELADCAEVSDATVRKRWEDLRAMIEGHG